MISFYLKNAEVPDYFARQKETLLRTIDELDETWKHSSVIKELCEKALSVIDGWEKGITHADEFDTYIVSGKIEKYTRWVEVMRLAFFQYERFTEKKSAKSEALYSTICSLALIWGGRNIKKIVVPGCGPGRTVLDFARLYPNAEVLGLDYSLLSLIVGNEIVCGRGNTQLLQRDVRVGEDISRLYNVAGFGLENAKFGLMNLCTNQVPKCDMIVCTNTLNLLPNQKIVLKSLIDSLNENGIIVFADLFGWRLDRMEDNRAMHDDSSMVDMFEKCGLVTLDYFSGVPYVESESGDQFVYYNEHFYVGKKEDQSNVI